MVATADKEKLHRDLDDILAQADEPTLRKLARYIAEEIKPEPVWMSVAEAAKHFGVGETTIREAVATNTIPWTKIQGRVIILVSKVKDQAVQALK